MNSNEGACARTTSRGVLRADTLSGGTRARDHSLRTRPLLRLCAVIALAGVSLAQAQTASRTAAAYPAKPSAPPLHRSSPPSLSSIP